ncbi:hypothetical protein [Cyanobium sp. Lug-B]|uniref:hypothetical protein n=1 Tax=Cyanobium sp. Lug-B TaxID=2823716 RepID=UPI0020CD9403|nr:hypothetical protein [Cyanobium sp. Lug-B]MCP9796227.1 hypothetical protein [Cyanobium sp. Lug-B]
MESPERFVFHRLNAWEKGDEVVIDSIFDSDFPCIGPAQDDMQVDAGRIPEGLPERGKDPLQASMTPDTASGGPRLRSAATLRVRQ